MTYKSLSLGAVYRTFEFVYLTECDRCGAVVTNEDLHNEFHAEFHTIMEEQ